MGMTTVSSWLSALMPYTQICPDLPLQSCLVSRDARIHISMGTTTATSWLS